MPASGHLLPSRAVPSDGSLSPDSCRADGVPVTAGMGPGCVKTQSDLVVMPRGARISAFFCSPRDHAPQNSWCAFTVCKVFTQPGPTSAVTGIPPAWRLLGNEPSNALKEGRSFGATDP